MEFRRVCVAFVRAYECVRFVGLLSVHDHTDAGGPQLCSKYNRQLKIGILCAGDASILCVRCAYSLLKLRHISWND